LADAQAGGELGQFPSLRLARGAKLGAQSGRLRFRHRTFHRGGEFAEVSLARF
jgi:hypothetical protein